MIFRLRLVAKRGGSLNWADAQGPRRRREGPVIKAFSEVFTPEVRDEAQRLFASGRVEVLAIDDAFLTTSVKDVTTERVVIKKRADRFQISCTCPEGKSGASCSDSAVSSRGSIGRLL